ncbi:hypothetical protein MC63_015565 [Shigella flexneri]|nr:hypothetical protein MC63_015565 [Shigella flexneri]
MPFYFRKECPLNSGYLIEIQYLRARFLQPCSCLAFPYSRSVHSLPQADNNFICISLYDVSMLDLPLYFQTSVIT